MANERAGAVEVGFRLLDVLADEPTGVSLGTAAERVGVPPATAHRIFQSWLTLGYARQDQATRAYELGPGLIRIGANAGRMFGYWARGQLNRLAQETGETATLSVLDGADVSVVAFAQPSHGLQVRMRLGRHAPAHSCAEGKVLLGQLQDEHVDALLEGTPLQRLTDRTVVDPSRLLAQLQTIRADGYAKEDGESEPGASSLAVPVDMRWPTAVALSGPTTRFKEEQVAHLLPLLRSTARKLNEARRRRESAEQPSSPAATERSGQPTPAS